MGGTLEMTDHPILFSGPMVRALLEGRKTQTRRIHKPSASSKSNRVPYHRRALSHGWLKVKEGDRLWVREAHYVWSAGGKNGAGRRISYRATEPDTPTTWTPSIHMPRWASRLTLIVTADARVERLLGIKGRDILAEGLRPPKGLPRQFWQLGLTDPDEIADITGNCCREDWHALWQSLHTKPGERLEDNPELVVIAFRVVHGNIDEVAV